VRWAYLHAIGQPVSFLRSLAFPATSVRMGCPTSPGRWLPSTPPFEKSVEDPVPNPTPQSHQQEQYCQNRQDKLPRTIGDGRSKSEAERNHEVDGGHPETLCGESDTFPIRSCIHCRQRMSEGDDLPLTTGTVTLS
jgi:hypothetical protein